MRMLKEVTTLFEVTEKEKLILARLLLDPEVWNRANEEERKFIQNFNYYFSVQDNWITENTFNK